jgi:hypothetical protein
LPHLRAFPTPFSQKVLSYQDLQSRLLILLSDEFVEKFIETLPVLIRVVPVRLFPLAVAGKVEIILLRAILKSTNQVRELSVVVYEVFSDGFERTQG